MYYDVSRKGCFLSVSLTPKTLTYYISTYLDYVRRILPLDLTFVIIVRQDNIYYIRHCFSDHLLNHAIPGLLNGEANIKCLVEVYSFFLPLARVVLFLRKEKLIQRLIKYVEYYSRTSSVFENDGLLNCFECNYNSVAIVNIRVLRL